VSTLAGGREPGFRDGLGGLSRLGSPLSMVMLPVEETETEKEEEGEQEAGNEHGTYSLMVADGSNRCIRRVDMDRQWPHTGNVTCAAGAACVALRQRELDEEEVTMATAGGEEGKEKRVGDEADGEGEGQGERNEGGGGGEGGEREDSGGEVGGEKGDVSTRELLERRWREEASKAKFSGDMRGMAVVQGAAPGDGADLVLVVDRAAYALRVINVKTGAVRTLAQASRGSGGGDDGLLEVPEDVVAGGGGGHGGGGGGGGDDGVGVGLDLGGGGGGPRGRQTGARAAADPEAYATLKRTRPLTMRASHRLREARRLRTAAAAAARAGKSEEDEVDA
jgi:hypothetical protein